MWHRFQFISFGEDGDVRTATRIRVAVRNLNEIRSGKNQLLALGQHINRPVLQPNLVRGYLAQRLTLRSFS